MITVTFDQSSYSVNEDVEVVQPTLVFSTPSLFNETIEVTSTYVLTNGMVNYVRTSCIVGCFEGENFQELIAICETFILEM